MANSLPFNAVAVDGEYDRVYKAEDWAWYFLLLSLQTAFFPKPSDGLQVVAYSGMEIRVNAGYAFINGYAFRNPATLSVTLDTAEGALNRVDRVVVRWDLPQRDMYIAVLKARHRLQKPTATAVTHYGNMGLCACRYLRRQGRLTRIQTQNITDQRFNSAVCGIVTGTVERDRRKRAYKAVYGLFTYSAAVLNEFSAYKQVWKSTLQRLRAYMTAT